MRKLEFVVLGALAQGCGDAEQNPNIQFSDIPYTGYIVVMKPANPVGSGKHTFTFLIDNDEMNGPDEVLVIYNSQDMPKSLEQAHKEICKRDQNEWDHYVLPGLQDQTFRTDKTKEFPESIAFAMAQAGFWFRSKEIEAEYRDSE